MVVATSLPWIALALISRDLLPGGERWITPLLGVTIVTTYVGLWVSIAALSHAPRRMLLRAIAATLGILVALALLELSAMVRWVHWTVVFRNLSGEGFDYRASYVPDQELAFRRIPSVHGTGRPASDIENSYGLPRTLERPITFTYDRWGYRNTADMPHADVVLLGDSMVEGWYVSDADTVSAQLAARIGRPVANLGVAGYGTLQQVRVLKTDALRRTPKVVGWFFFEGNDLYDDQHFENGQTASVPARDERTGRLAGGTETHGWRQRSFVRNLFWQMRRWSHPLVPTRAPYWAYLGGRHGHGERVYFYPYGGVEWTDYEEKRWTVARAAFEDGLAFARAHDIKLVFFYVPIKYRVLRDVIEVPPGSPMEHWDVWHALPIHFRDFCTEAGVPCIDLTDRLRHAVSEGRLTYPVNDTHWSREGHTVAAAAMQEVLRQHGW